MVEVGVVSLLVARAVSKVWWLSVASDKIPSARKRDSPKDVSSDFEDVNEFVLSLLVTSDGSEAESK